MNNKRITIFMGHYGSGKTFNAVNYAIFLKQKFGKVSIYDLDIVNPYYRTVDAKNMLDKSGVELVVSPFAETNVDIPAMNSKSYKMVDDKSSYAVLDIGGDDRGALALGRFNQKIKEENNYECLWVVNCFRPETKDIDSALEIKREIEQVSKIPFTGIVNNSNLGFETDFNCIEKGLDFCNRLCKIANLNLKYTAVRKDLINDNYNKLGEILPVEPIKYGDWL